MARNVDFDAAWDALTGAQAAPVVTVEGERVTLPSEPPLALVLLRRKLLNAEGRGVSITQARKVLGLVFGDERVDRWVDERGIGLDKLCMLIVTLPAAWLPDPEEGDGEGEAQPPETGEPASSSTTSSTDGGSSSPTSTAPIAST